MLEVLSQDYVRTAKAKGIGSTTVLFLHALKNAAVPIVTVIGIGVALLIGGSVVTESVFAIPGLGRLVVDAMDLAWSKPHVDTFVIVSGDSDFSPLVSKLKENGKHVIGLGMKGSTSELLRDNCDEFIYYEDLERQEQDEQQLATNLYADMPDRKREVYTLLVEACNALRRENHEILYASMIKDTMKRKKPSFDESYYGYRSFTHLLEEADNVGTVDIERNPKSGTYVVTRFGERESPKPVLEPRPHHSNRR